MHKLSQLKVKRSQTLSEAQALLTQGFKSSEEKAKYEELIAAVDLIDRDIASLEKIERHFQENPSLRPASSQAAPTSTAAPAVIKRDNETNEQTRQRLNTAYRSLLSHGYSPDKFAEQRDITTGSSGIPLIPQEIFPVLGTVAKYYAPLLDYVTVQENTTGRPTRFVSEDDSSNFLVAGSEGTASTEVDQVFAKTILNHDAVTGLITVSLQLLNDSAFDLNDVIQKSAARRLGRSLESILTNAVDPANNAMPNNQGLVHAASVGTTTTALANGVGMADLANLVESLDPTYWPKAAFMFSGGTYAYLMKQTDGSGRRFWPELGDMKLWSFDVIINNSLPQSFSSGGVPILFGDYSTYGVSHTGLGIQTLFERFADTFKRGFVLSSRISSQQLSPGGIKALKLAAS